MKTKKTRRVIYLWLLVLCMLQTAFATRPQNGFFYNNNVRDTTLWLGSGTDSITMIFVEGATDVPLSTGTQDISDFWIGQVELTRSQWLAVMSFNSGSYLPKKPDDVSTSSTSYPDYPVNNVSWYDVLAYCNRLSVIKSLTPVYYTNSGLTAVFSPNGSVLQSGDIYIKGDADGFRLLTEQEWEYAARGGQPAILGGTFNDTCAGSNTVGDVAWYNNNAGSTSHPVGLKTPNELFLYDMSGNVWEWTSSPWSTGSSGRVIRGGSWDNDARYSGVDSRYNYNPSYRRRHVGLRLALSSP